MQSPAANKVWLVTGASSGLGRAVVIHLLEQGDTVVATLRKPQDISDLSLKYSESQLLILKLDVTSMDDISAAFAKAIEKYGRIDVVYNNAGFPALGEIEGTPNDVARSLFEVNFWGATNVSLEAVRVFRDVNKPPGGRLLQASSMAGVQAIPALGFYSASKFALEGISHALQGELSPSWNIKITLLEIGSFKTRVVHPQSMVTAPQLPVYSGPDSATAPLRAYLAGPGLEGGADADKAAREMRKIALDDSVPLRVPLGVDAIEVVVNEWQTRGKDAEAARKWSADLEFTTA